MAHTFEKAVADYNDMMEALGLEHVTIGTCFSESTEGWNIRDMVSEAQYWLDIYNDPSTATGSMKNSRDIFERTTWATDTLYLRVFIDRYEPDIADVVCVSGHCSKYDNKR